MAYLTLLLKCLLTQTVNTKKVITQEEFIMNLD